MIKVNEYFESKVKSLSFESFTGAATVGVILPGKYEFGTGKKEIMNIISGKSSVKLPNQSQTISVNSGEKFEVAANSKFEIEAITEVAYFCQFID